MVPSKMDKIENLEATITAIQKHMEEKDHEQDQRLMDFQASMSAMVQQLVVRMDGQGGNHDQRLGGGSHNPNGEGGQGENEARDEGSNGHRQIRTMELWRKLDVPLFQGDDAYA